MSASEGQHWVETEASGREAGMRAIERVTSLESDLDHALATVGAFRQAIEDIFTKAEGSVTDDGTVRFYTLPTGPLHKAIGLARGTNAGGKLLALAARLVQDNAALVEAVCPQSNGNMGDEYEPVAFTCLICDASGDTRADIQHESYCALAAAAPARAPAETCAACAIENDEYVKRVCGHRTNSAPAETVEVGE